MNGSSTPTPAVHSYRCPACSADLAYEPKEGCLECPYCHRQEKIPASVEEIKENAYQEYLAEKPERLQVLAENAREVQCASCGALVSFMPTEVTAECSFCGAQFVAQPKSADPVIAPEGVLPFSIPQAQALERVKAWLSTRWFAPNALKMVARPGKLQGVYLPFWTYDANTFSHYRGMRGEHYWVTESYTERDENGREVAKTRQVQKTRWFPAAGSVSRWFDDVLVAASRALPARRLEALTPWDLEVLQPYDPAFLAGFKAQRYQVSLQEGFEEAQKVMASVIQEDVRRDIGGDEQRIEEIKTAYSGITFKHLLLPVWVTAYRFNQKVYQVMVNARTGEVQGDRPYSPWKITALVLFLLGVFLVILLLKRH
jgi:DNA-directed RNA polymerase subunit RPC12/RpoP